MPFPAGEFTPFGYLRNPGHRATAWGASEGGNLRTSTDRPGVEWVYPWQRDPAASAGLVLTTVVGGRPCQSRADFAAVGLTSRYHSASVLGLDWRAEEVDVAARAFLVDDDTLALRVGVANLAATPRRLRLGLLGRLRARGGGARAERRPSGVVVLLSPPGLPAPAAHAVALRVPCRAAPSDAADAPPDDACAGWEADLALDPGQTADLLVCLARGPNPAAAEARAVAGLADAPDRLLAHLAGDNAFWATAPELTGDWPAGWPAGLVYDLETTRSLVQPPRGIFADVWPTWMVGYPRVVLAEGAMDMHRLAYGDPTLARRAVLSLFRDAPAPNVPCVFEGGEPNMLAADGSACGTSPAWCLPFLHLELLYLRAPDRAWLADLYPYLVRYLDWWLAHRADARGWIVYRCTWEAGEDGSPRLDPSGSGDRDIATRVRPVELQAAVAQAATTLGFFAAELGLADDRRRWARVRAAYRRRLRRLFDAQAGRFRDWLVAERRFQSPCPDSPYWGADACRFGPLALTPLLAGLATREQAAALAVEVERHACAPWTAWPSWCTVLVECAAAAGLFETAGEVVGEVVDRVYRVTTRREVADLPRPMPGAAPEFWPRDWRTFDGADAYGWGAATATLLLRHLVGFKEARPAHRWTALLTPALPLALRREGRCYGVRRLSYRGVVFDLTLAVGPRGLDVSLDLDVPRRCAVRRVGPRGAVYASRRPATRHTFPATVGQAYRLTLS